ncbi:uncharacterized protein [Phyllobates terribilis]|uniref:uncharacterized protein n=1 Tax=Phyllobates terribilis TaxID=111132 RepID=UPI003CCB1DB4
MHKKGTPRKTASRSISDLFMAQHTDGAAEMAAAGSSLSAKQPEDSMVAPDEQQTTSDSIPLHSNIRPPPASSLYTHHVIHASPKVEHTEQPAYSSSYFVERTILSGDTHAQAHARTSTNHGRSPKSLTSLPVMSPEMVKRQSNSWLPIGYRLLLNPPTLQIHAARFLTAPCRSLAVDIACLHTYSYQRSGIPGSTRYFDQHSDFS